MIVALGWEKQSHHSPPGDSNQPLAGSVVAAVSAAFAAVQAAIASFYDAAAETQRDQATKTQG